MHPQLSDAKREKCGGVIEALEMCHRMGYMARMLGSCNEAKEALNRCLRAERLDRAKENMLKAREKRKKIEQRWKEVEEEEWGPEGLLKNVAGKPAPK